MSLIFDKMQNLASAIDAKIAVTGELIEPWVQKEFSWFNRVYKSDKYRRAHIEVLDVRDTKKMWIMHICIFPHIDDSSPIFGFDVICGANKITGIFHDFSVSGDYDHFMMKWFENQVANLKWKKDRELPDWGKRIFSPFMISAGNINTEEELNKIVEVAIANLDYYLANVGMTRHASSFASEHNYYCQNQKQNVHTKRFLSQIVGEEVAEKFIQKHLFPEIS